MIHFTPTLGIKESAKNIKTFVKDNMAIFWEIFKPLAPYVFALHILDLILSIFVMPVDSDTGQRTDIGLGAVIAGYFYTCLAITWHRVVIHGADNYIPMNPLKPKKSELAFIGMGIVLFMAMFIISFILGFTAYFTSPALLLLIAPVIIIGGYLWMKFMFYFPAKATGNHITLKQSFAMTKGYIWKMIAANFLATIKWFFIMLAVLLAFFIVSSGIGFALGKIGLNEDFVVLLVGIAYLVPVTLFFQPLFAVIWVTTLSNYYQHALQNKGLPNND